MLETKVAPPHRSPSGFAAPGKGWKSGGAFRASGERRSRYLPVNIDGIEYGSTVNTMKMCPTVRATIASIDMKCQYRAHTYPPNSIVSGDNCTGFQIAIPVSTVMAATIGIEK